MSQTVRVQAKSAQAEASRWFESDPYTSPYVALDEYVDEGKAWINPHPKVVLIRPEFTQPQQPQQRVLDGYYIVKRRESEYVEVYSPDEFARRFNVVQPDAIEFVPTTQEQLAPYQPPHH